ncbi:hypothetical protein ACN47A_29230 [Myxococcus fulvus]|uniref:hypothetical protein n=1 Tax=Myxococcus fulvus TaxID=33 RepID=UPI003B9D31E4
MPLLLGAEEVVVSAAGASSVVLVGADVTARPSAALVTSLVLGVDEVADCAVRLVSAAPVSADATVGTFAALVRSLALSPDEVAGCTAGSTDWKDSSARAGDDVVTVSGVAVLNAPSSLVGVVSSVSVAFGCSAWLVEVVDADAVAPLAAPETVASLVAAVEDDVAGCVATVVESGDSTSATGAGDAAEPGAMSANPFVPAELEPSFGVDAVAGSAELADGESVVSAGCTVDGEGVVSRVSRSSPKSASAVSVDRDAGETVAPCDSAVSGRASGCSAVTVGPVAKGLWVSAANPELAPLAEAGSSSSGPNRLAVMSKSSPVSPTEASCVSGGGAVLASTCACGASAGLGAAPEMSEVPGSVPEPSSCRATAS